jgi:hypothetical protein
MRTLFFAPVVGIRLTALTVSFISCLASTPRDLQRLVYDDVLAQASAEAWARLDELQVMLVESGPDSDYLKKIGFEKMFSDVIRKAEEDTGNLDRLTDAVTEVLIYLPDASPRISRERRLLKDILSTLLALEESRPGKPERRPELHLMNFIHRAAKLFNLLIEKGKNQLSVDSLDKITEVKLGMEAITLLSDFAKIRGTEDTDISFRNPTFANASRFLLVAWGHLVPSLPYKTGVGNVHCLSRTIELMADELSMIERRMKSAQATQT